MKQQGPKQIVIPEQRFMSCYGCEFHEHKLTRSGRDPTYAENCNHPDFPIVKDIMRGNLSKDRDGHLKTPLQCPFRKKERDESLYDGTHSGTVGRGVMTNFEKTQYNEHGTITE